MENFKECGLVSLCKKEGHCMKYKYIRSYPTKAQNLAAALKFELACETAKTFARTQDQREKVRQTETVPVKEDGTPVQTTFFDGARQEPGVRANEGFNIPKDVPVCEHWRYILGAEKNGSSCRKMA